VAEPARYLYAIVRALPEGADLGTGLGGRPLDVVRELDLAAVVSTVDLDEFGEDALRANLERLDWLEDVARTHDAVVHTVAGHGPTAPMRLATICLGDEAVRTRIEERYDALMEVLDRVQDCREWSVKLLAPATAQTARPEPVAAGSMGGAEFLRRKKEQSQARFDHEAEALAIAEHAHDELSASTRASRRLPAQDPRLTGHVGTMVLNAAYLVHVHDEPDFLDALQRVTEQAGPVTVESAGPWPPYSFAVLDES
jgi:hypothetical protein